MRSFIFIIILVALSITQTKGCTIFSISDSCSAILGNSEDYWERGYMSVRPGTVKEFGRIVFHFADKYVQGGINEYGLAGDGTGAIKEMPFIYDLSKIDLPSNENILEEVLKNCKNVPEAIEYCKKYNLPVLGMAHLMFGDASGRSVVIETDKKGFPEFLEKSENFQVLTNFNLSNPTIGYYPCYRYDTAMKLLPSTQAKVWEAITVLKAVRQNILAYAHIYDCKNKTFHLFSERNYTRGLEFNVNELLQKGPDCKFIDSLPKVSNVVCPEDQSKENFEISFQAPEGEYKILLSQDKNMKSAQEIICSQNIHNLAFVFPLFLILAVRKRHKFLQLICFIVFCFMLITCKKDEVETITYKQEVDYKAQINLVSPGTWYWMVSGTTKDGYHLQTTPVSLKIQ